MQYFPLLQRAGFDVAHAAVSGGIFNYLYALRSAAAADIVVILRKTFPAPMLWLLRWLSSRLVYDFDDAVFCNSDGSPSATRMRRFTAMAGTCDHILAGNGFLAGTAARFNPAVTVIPTSRTRVNTRPRAQNLMTVLTWSGLEADRQGNTCLKCCRPCALRRYAYLDCV